MRISLILNTQSISNQLLSRPLYTLELDNGDAFCSFSLSQEHLDTLVKEIESALHIQRERTKRAF